MRRATDTWHLREGREQRAFPRLGISYLFGLCSNMMVPGARIELATPAFSGRRSTNELPRHFEELFHFRDDTNSCQFAPRPDSAPRLATMSIITPKKSPIIP